jgi:hypothetical protein
VHRLLPLALALLALSGCGSAEDRVRSSVERFLEASQEQDFARMCKHLLWDGGDCETMLAQDAMQHGRRSVPMPRIVDVKVLGKAATVVLDGPALDADGSLSLVEIGHHWRIQPEV